jgi:predicted acetyltransferase
VEIRLIGDDEVQDAYYLSAQAFRCGARDDNFAAKRQADLDKPDTVGIGVFDEAGLQAKVMVIAYEEVFDTRFVAPMGGIGGVACLPASRGKGYAAAGLKHALEIMKDSGQYLSALYPFSWAFYRTLGWEWVGVHREYKVPAAILKAVPETDAVREATAADRPGIAAAYSEYCKRYRGMAQRDTRAWNRMLNHRDGHYTYIYIYEGACGVEGYLTFSGMDRETTGISEFITLTTSAQRALLGLLKRHDMQVKNFKWNAPEDDLFWSTLYHNDLQTSISTVTQARVVDVVPAVAALKPSAELRGNAVIQIADACAPWNEGVWKIEVEGGAASAIRTTETADVCCDIQAFTQIYYGSPGPGALREHGGIAVNSEEAYTLLTDLFAGPPMWLNDHF